MKYYIIPEEYKYRIHHVRPRFKNNIENVLFYLSEEFAKIEKTSISDYKTNANECIRRFPGNSTKSEKTINNWRTEIAALFGFYIEDKDKDIVETGKRAVELSVNQDLVRFFKTFLYFFQYPGGHIKPKENIELINRGIKFKPVNKIIEILLAGKKISKKSFGINKAEAAYCIFNDLRCTKNIETPYDTAKRILNNRKEKLRYISKGDIIRYAGDILDYMTISNLLIKKYNYYSLNIKEIDSINYYLKSDKWFCGYDDLYEKLNNIDDLQGIEINWFNYVNQNIPDNIFGTDFGSLLSSDESKSKELYTSLEELQKLFDYNDANLLNDTKRIGDFGENIVFGHECMRIKLCGREDLINFIKLIPTVYAVGYDIQSIESDGSKRYIEVKTTVSNKPLTFFKFSLTPNEWNTAKSLEGRYYIYRLFLNNEGCKLFIMRDPTNLYKNNKLEMFLNPKTGVEISFEPNIAGSFEKLLIWKN